MPSHRLLRRARLGMIPLALPSTVAETHTALGLARQEARRLLSHLNAFAPVLRLPPEILSNILIFLKYTPPASAPPSHIGKSPHANYHWVTYTHVCRRWRDIALQCPVLWSDIFIGVSDVRAHSVDAAETMIRRSGTAPLKVEVIYWDAEDPRDMIATLQELYRIQEFITSMYANPINADSFPQLKTLELGDAPLLRRLWLNGSSIWFSSSQTASPTFGSLQELLYREVPPEVEFRSLLRPTLTHVSLELLSEDESALDLLQALRGMECLQFLALLQMSIAPVPPLGWLGPQTWVCVTLPHLRRLDLRTVSCKPWINFLRHLSVPLSARFLISFTYTMKPQAADICAFLCDKVESLDYKGYQPGVLWPFSSFAIDRGRTVLWTADSAYNISSSERFSSHSNAEEMSWYSYIHFWLSHSNPALRLLSAETALSAFRLPSSGVRALYYKWQESEIPSRVALENMRHVETLCVTPQEYVPQDLCVQPDVVGCDEQSPRVVTDSDVVSGEPSVHPRALFPKLETLIILRSSYKQVPYPHWKEWWCKLISSLASRRDSTLVPQVKKLILVLPPPRPNAELLTKTNVRDVLQVVTEFVEVERGSDTYREVFRVLGESGQCPHGFRNFVESRV